jgi:hypothetical protein
MKEMIRPKAAGLPTFANVAENGLGNYLQSIKAAGDSARAVFLFAVTPDVTPQ